MEEKEKVENLIGAGTEITGGVIGGLLGFFIAGPTGAVLGGAGGPIASSALKKIASEFSSRVLAHREEIRVGAVLLYVVEKIQNNLDNGRILRDDGFFAPNINTRSSADEILEAGMLATQKEYEEKKLKYYGNLIANISFDTTFSKAQANHLIKTAQALSWRQICVLSLAVRKGAFQLRNESYRTQQTFTQEQIFLLQEIFDLYNKNIITFGTGVLLGVTDIQPSIISTEGVGAHLYNMMNLSEIPDNEIRDVATILS